MPDAVRTMCSFKIIRSGSDPQRPFVLESLGGGPVSQEPDVFRAVALGRPDAREEPEEELPPPPPPPPTMLEEEALRLIDQARLDGAKEGREQAEAELASAGEALAQALELTRALRGKLLHEAEEDLLQLSVLIARKVMLRELSLDPGVLAGLVQAAVKLASESGEVLVKLNPEDLALATECGAFRQLLAESGVKLTADAAVARAGCLAETVRGNIDAGLDAQLDEIFRGLTEERNARREQPVD